MTVMMRYAPTLVLLACALAHELGDRAVAPWLVVFAVAIALSEYQTERRRQRGGH